MVTGPPASSAPQNHGPEVTSDRLGSPSWFGDLHGLGSSIKRNLPVPKGSGLARWAWGQCLGTPPRRREGVMPCALGDIVNVPAVPCVPWGHCGCISHALCPTAWPGHANHAQWDALAVPGSIVPLSASVRVLGSRVINSAKEVAQGDTCQGDLLAVGDNAENGVRGCDGDPRAPTEPPSLLPMSSRWHHSHPVPVPGSRHESGCVTCWFPRKPAGTGGASRGRRTGPRCPRLRTPAPSEGGPGGHRGEERSRGRGARPSCQRGSDTTSSRSTL